MASALRNARTEEVASPRARSLLLNLPTTAASEQLHLSPRCWDAAMLSSPARRPGERDFRLLANAMRIQNCTVIYLDEAGRNELGIGFVARPDTAQFVGFVRPYSIEEDDDRYRPGTVSIELGLREMEPGIFADGLERVWFDGIRVLVELGGPLSGNLEIGIDATTSDLARLSTALDVLFDGTGRYVDTSTQSRVDGVDR
jgi:hypothetical protein